MGMGASSHAGCLTSNTDESGRGVRTPSFGADDGKGGKGKLHCLKGTTLLLHSFIDGEDEEEDMIL
jgi:hypothetical protein